MVMLNLSKEDSEFFKIWAKRIGSIKTAKKARSSKLNGLKGGRPKGSKNKLCSGFSQQEKGG
jgi:hypothetical protein